MNRINIDNLIVNLMTIYNTAKDVHYSCSGANFYGNHLFADRIAENLHEYIDQLKEICLLGRGQEPLKSFDYMARAVEKIPRVSNFETLREVIEKGLITIEHCSGLSKADENVIGAIAQDLQNNIGLLNIMEGN